MNANRIPIDPDLAVALDELAEVAVRLRRVEENIRALHRPEDYRKLGWAIAERDDLNGRINARAERLNIRGRALLLFVEEAMRLRHKSGRRPTLAQLQDAVFASREALTRHRGEVEAERVIAESRAREAAFAVKIADTAVKYLEACA